MPGDTLPEWAKSVALAASRDGIAILTSAGTFVYANASHARLYGYDSPQQLIGTSWRDLYEADEVSRLETEALPRVREEGAWLGEARGRRRDGTFFAQEVSLSVFADGAYFVCVVRDVSDRKAAEAEVHRQAFEDPLTGLRNRTSFLATLHGRFSQGGDAPSAIVLIDLDGFSGFNDTLGQRVGDLLLRDIGKRIADEVGTAALVFRLSGDEFALLVDSGDPATVDRLAEAVLQAVREPFDIEDRELLVSATIGAGVSPADGSDPSSLLSSADLALSGAKARRRGGYQRYSAELGQPIQHAMEIGTGLRHAVARGELELVYQPIVSLHTGRVAAVEALLRWRRADGLVHPATFIPIAERTGQVREIGSWVVRRACAEMAAMEPFQATRLCLNLSPRELLQPELATILPAMVRAAGWDMHALELEITETAALEDLETTCAVLDSLRSQGARIALDDFGAGYSSLAALRQLPIDTLKLDKTFLEQLGGGNASITRAVTDLAHALDLHVVAEGVESAEQLEFLRSIGCDGAQGYWLCTPLPLPALGAHLSNHGVAR